MTSVPTWGSSSRYSMIDGKDALLAMPVTSAGFAALRRELGHLEKLARVLEPLDEAGDHAGGGVIEQVPREVGTIEVRLIARGDDVAESYARVRGPRQERPERRSPTLADETHWSRHALRPARRRGGPDVVLDIGEAEAIRPTQAQSGVTGEDPQLRL